MRRTALTATTAIAVLLLSGCAASTAEPSNAGAAASVNGTATTPCVADPEAVATRQPTAQMDGPMLPETASLLDRTVASAMPQAAAPGAVVAVRTPTGTWIKAYGVADPTTNSPMTDDVYQRVGSVTKTFTGTLILQLAAEGQLNLDDTIGRYIDGIPNGDKVTLRELANMTSGLASYTLDDRWQKVFFDDPQAVWTPDQLVDIARNLDPLFPPGEKFDYSNTNTILLGQVVEKVTGESYGDALRTRIFEPLKLGSTSFPGLSAAFPDPHAQGYTLQANDATPDHPVNATDWNPSWGWSAGEIISNGRDLLAYGRALGTGQGLLPAAMQEQRLTSFPSGREAPSYGFALGCSAGWVGHTGELPGFNTTLYYQTDADITVVVLVNSDIASGSCTQSALLSENDETIACSPPAARIFTAVASALGRPFLMPPQK
jgi:D-alanyl-D-alanine carboxypeptidase